MKKIRNSYFIHSKKINLEIYQDIFLNEKKIETREAKAFLQQRIPEVKREIKNEIDFHTKNMLNNIDKELSQIKNKK
jgi:redox-regulated HSP33 family molecular chaperone